MRPCAVARGAVAGETTKGFFVAPLVRGATRLEHFHQDRAHLWIGACFRSFEALVVVKITDIWIGAEREQVPHLPEYATAVTPRLK